MDDLGTAADSLQNLDRVKSFYCSLRPVERGEMSIYAIWEQGLAFNDSVTPSTYCSDYRSHVVLKIVSLTPRDACIFSVGCGNGFVEKDLICRERRVVAMDCNEEATALTREKGVEVFTADYFSLHPSAVGDADMIYGDGLLGHLFTPDQELGRALDKLEQLRLKAGTLLMFSNDSPREPSVPYAPHDKVENFWFISRHYLQQTLVSFGYEPLECYYFPYVRPISGLRNRTICIVRVP